MYALLFKKLSPNKKNTNRTLQHETLNYSSFQVILLDTVQTFMNAFASVLIYFLFFSLPLLNGVWQVSVACFAVYGGSADIFIFVCEDGISRVVATLWLSSCMVSFVGVRNVLVMT